MIPALSPCARGGVAAATVLAFLAAPGAAFSRPAPDGFADLVEALSPGVVAVAVEKTGAPGGRPFAGPRGFPFEKFFRRHFGERAPGADRRGERRPEPRAMAAGSGFIIDPEGHVVTNHHVIDRGGDIAVTLQTGERLPATLVGADPRTDIALLKVEADRPLPALRWGDSDAVRVGDWSLAIGNPFGFGGTVTAGIVSGRARDIDSGPYDDFLQTDAPINPGNSGGPLFDLDGGVIGINTAIVSPSGGNVGIGFAIPAGLAAPIVAQLREHGRAVRGWLGVRLQPLTPNIAAGLDLPEASGALVAQAMPETPAAAAGIETGDVIVSWDGRPVDGPRRLARLVSETPAGETVAVGAIRDGRQVRFDVEVAEMAEPAAVAAAPAAARAEAGLGLTVAPAPDGGGLSVVAVARGGPAARVGLRPGDVIREAGRRPVADAAALDAAIAEAEEDGRAALLLLIERDGAPLFRAAPLGVG